MRSLKISTHSNSCWTLVWEHNFLWKILTKVAILALIFWKFCANELFGEKTRIFRRFSKSLKISYLGLFLKKNGVPRFSKVNAFWKFGVDFWKFGVLTETRKVAKIEQKTCTKAGPMCKFSPSAAGFFIGRRLSKARKRPFFTPECFAAVKQIFCERFWHFIYKYVAHTQIVDVEIIDNNIISEEKYMSPSTVISLPYSFVRKIKHYLARSKDYFAVIHWPFAYFSLLYLVVSFFFRIFATVPIRTSFINNHKLQTIMPP